VASHAPGYLFVTAQPWVEVWVDGEKVARETPVRGLEVPSGKHTMRFVNPASKKGDRIGYKKLADGKKVRFFKSNGEMLDA